MRVLIFDWEEDLVDLLSYNLNLNGFEVITAACEEDLLAKAAEEKPPLVMVSGFPDYQQQMEIIDNLEQLSPESLIINMATQLEHTTEGMICGPNLVCVGTPVEMRTLISIVKSHMSSAESLDKAS